MVNPMNKNNEFHVLEEIVDRIHDCWFDADSIQSAKEANEIEISLFINNPKSPSREADYHFGTLHIRNIIKISLVDHEKIQYYDINEILWNSDDNKFTFVTNIPLVFQIFVSKMDISLVCQ